MKTFIKFIVLLCVLPLISNCKPSDDNQRTTRERSLEAAINPTCTNEITFNDLDDNVYAYRGEDFGGVYYIQAGGHSDVDELTDLGLNIFLDLESLATGNYAIGGGSTVPGTAYVYYYRIDGTIWISTDSNTSNLVVEVLEINDDNEVTKLRGSFNNVEIANNDNPSETQCINAFELIFTL